MKKYILFLITALTLLSSCNKSNQRNNYNSLIIGKWNSLNIERALTNVPGSSNPSRHISYTFSKGEYIEFFDDGTYNEFGGDRGQNLYTPSIHSGTYSITGSTLYTKLNYPSQSFFDTVQIQTITDRKLTLYDIYPYRGGTEESWDNYLR